MKKVFIASYGGGHANIMKLLYPELVNSFEVELMALTLADVIFKDADIPHRTIKDYLIFFDEDKQKEIINYGRQLAKTEYNPNSSMTKEDCVVYLGMGMIDLVSSLNSLDLAQKELHDKGRKAFCPIQVAKTILQHVIPDIVVLSSSVRFEAAVGIAANKIGIPVLHIRDLPVAINLPYYADVCVMNAYTEKLLNFSKNKNIKNVFTTGQPVFNNVDNVSINRINALKEMLNLDSYNNVIVFLEEPASETNEVIEQFLETEASHNATSLYIFKLHPNMDISEKIEYIRDNCIRVRDIDLLALLANTDVAISRISTSALEAAFMDVDIIIANIENTPLSIDYSDFGIALKANSLDEIKQYISELILNKTDKFNLKKHRLAFKNRPNAAKNISDVISMILKEH